MRNLKVSYESLLIEVPVVIKNSTLTNILMCELEDMIPSCKGFNFLDLSTSSVLEGQLRSLMEHVDDLNQEAIKFNRLVEERLSKVIVDFQTKGSLTKIVV